MILIQLLYSNTSHFGPPYLEHYKLNYIHCYQVTNIFVNIKIKQKWITDKPGKRTPKESINEFIIQKLNPLIVVDFRLMSAFLYV